MNIYKLFLQAVIIFSAVLLIYSYNQEQRLNAAILRNIPDKSDEVILKVKAEKGESAETSVEFN